MYGHMDKQPEFTGWRNDLGPWTPKYEDGKLYGRGGADDGYAVYASIAAVQALKSQKVAHPRIVGLIETCEESGSARPVALHRRAASATGRCGAGDLPGQRRRQLRPAVADHQPARHGQRHAQGRGADRRACIPAMHPAWCPAVSASCARCWTGWKTARRAACCPPASTARCRRAAGAGAGHRGHPGRRGLQALPLGALRLRRLHRLHAAHHHRPGAGPAQPHLDAHAQRDRRRGLPRAQGRRQRAAPRTPPSSSACACRRWWTRRRPCRR
jgi:hypothetical protein